MSSQPKTIEEYIDSMPKEAHEKLHQMRDAIREAAPDAKEGLKWSMPAFSYKRILVTFAAAKHHIGFYPTPSAVTAFKEDLKDYKTARGSIQFPLEKPLPITLIKKITAFRVKESKEEDARWKV